MSKGVIKGYESLKEHSENQAKEIRRLKAAIQLLHQEKALYMTSDENRTLIIHQQLTAKNEEIQRLSEEIVRLRVALRELRGE